ncbi:hypothetical protein [Pseudomonas viridiflava]|uniref:hypothetical protein n=1 Tax=Pseudomonas viridiflava TaxID=33069 RepID=UPI0013CEE8C1|nr:hypothetical protein [Pseudomonas viridiflava]
MGYFMFDKRRLAGDAASAVSQADRVIVHRRQAASHKTVFFRLFPASGRHLHVGTAKAQKAKGFPLALWLLPLSVNLTVDQKSPRKVRT